MKYLLALLLIVQVAFATTTQLAPTYDTFVDSTNRTLNYGATPGYYLGNRSGTAETNYLCYFDYQAAGIPTSGITVSSAICTLQCDAFTTSTVWYIRARLLDSTWVPGTGNAAYQNGSSSWNNQGFGSSTVDGSTIATADSCWGSCAATTVPPKGGAWSTAVIDSFQVTASPANLFLVFDLASGVQSQIDNGKNFGFHFFGTSTTANQRAVVYANEWADAALRPRIYVTWQYTVAEDSTFLRINVAPPSAPLNDYPVLVDFLTYPNNASLALTFYDSDSTTKLYWWPDSMSGHYMRAWVINDWDTDPDSIYVQRVDNPSYRNADSVFILHDAFNNAYSVSRSITDWDAFTGMTFDTSGIMLNATGGVGQVDSFLREVGGPMYDWVNDKWYIFACGEGPLTAAANRYDDNFLLRYSSSTLSGEWTLEDTVMYDSSGVRQAVNAEDPDGVWLPDLGKWMMVMEDHDSSEFYTISALLADSLNQDVWEKRYLHVFDASTSGTPTNWLDKEQASPALCFVPTLDTLLLFFEAFGSSGRSYMGMAVSFNNASNGDTLGLDWYLTDSTGAVNESNPMPIVPWLQTGQEDSAHTIPDAALYTNGQYFLLNHGDGTVIKYLGDSPRNLVYQPKVATDSVIVGSVIALDTASGDYVTTYIEDISNDVILCKPRDFDSTRNISSKWNSLIRANRPITTNRWICYELYESNGILTMYPPQRVTGVVALQSKVKHDAGFIWETWCQSTEWTAEPILVFAFGSDTLQGYNGLQTQNAVWYYPQLKWGYDATTNPSSIRFARDANGAVHTNLGTGGTVGVDTLSSMHKWTIKYTTGDSLFVYVDGLLKTKAKDVTYNGLDKSFTILQADKGEADWGGVFRADSVRIRNFATAEAVATASDTLYFNESATLEEENWNNWKSWSTWGKW